MGMSWAEHTEEIDAPIDVCFDAIVDYESFPGWQGAVDSVKVTSRTKDGLGEDVHLFVDAKVRKIDYVLRYRYDRPTEIRWDFVDVAHPVALDEVPPDLGRAVVAVAEHVVDLAHLRVDEQVHVLTEPVLGPGPDLD